jgi:hypothetical protein
MNWSLTDNPLANAAKWAYNGIEKNIVDPVVGAGSSALKSIKDLPDTLSLTSNEEAVNSSHSFQAQIVSGLPALETQLEGFLPGIDSSQIAKVVVSLQQRFGTEPRGIKLFQDFVNGAHVSRNDLIANKVMTEDAFNTYFGDQETLSKFEMFDLLLSELPTISNQILEPDLGNVLTRSLSSTKFVFLDESQSFESTIHTQYTHLNWNPKNKPIDQLRMVFDDLSNLKEGDTPSNISLLSIVGEQMNIRIPSTDKDPLTLSIPMKRFNNFLHFWNAKVTRSQTTSQAEVKDDLFKAFLLFLKREIRVSAKFPNNEVSVKRGSAQSKRNSLTLEPSGENGSIASPVTVKREKITSMVALYEKIKKSNILWGNITAEVKKNLHLVTAENLKFLSTQIHKLRLPEAKHLESEIKAILPKFNFEGAGVTLKGNQLPPEAQGRLVSLLSKLMAVVMAQESSGMPDLVSKSGAVGLMQGMPISFFQAMERGWNPYKGIKSRNDVPGDKKQSYDTFKKLKIQNGKYDTSSRVIRVKIKQDGTATLTPASRKSDKPAFPDGVFPRILKIYLGSNPRTQVQFFVDDQEMMENVVKELRVLAPQYSNEQIALKKEGASKKNIRRIKRSLKKLMHRSTLTEYFKNPQLNISFGVFFLIREKGLDIKAYNGRDPEEGKKTASIYQKEVLTAYANIYSDISA